MHEYLKEPSKNQFIITLLLSAVLLSVFLYFLLNGALTGTDDIIWYMLPEAVIWFNFFLYRNYISNRKLAYVPVKKENRL